jgi:polyribonucleotide nucleotidyltransferase
MEILMGQFLDGLKKDLNKIKKIVKKGSRGLEDFIEPPSTEEKFKRIMNDFADGDLESAINGVSKEVKGFFRELKDEFKALIGDDTLANDMLKGFNKLAEKIDKSIIKSPILNEFSNVLKKAGEFVKSLAGTEKNRAKAWGNLIKASTDMGKTIKKSFVNKINTPNNNVSRGR